MAHTQYSFALPVGFALVGGSTSVAGAPAPLAGGPALAAAMPASSSGGYVPPAGAAAPLVGGAALIDGSAAVSGAPASLGGGSSPAGGAPTSLAREPAPSGESGWPEGLPIGLLQDRERARNREALMRSGAPLRRGRVEEGAAPGALSRLSPRPPEPAESRQPGCAAGMEELCEELIARLRRELLVERERMGTLFGA